MKMYDNFFRRSGKLLPFLLLFSPLALAENYSPAQLTELARQWLQTQTSSSDKIEVTPLDSRLGLKN